MDEELDYTLTLTDDEGNEAVFVYLDCIEYEDKEYLVVEPEEEEGQLVILEVQPVDEENENYIGVEDEGILNAVYCIFKERYKDELTFED